MFFNIEKHFTRPTYLLRYAECFHAFCRFSWFILSRRIGRHIEPLRPREAYHLEYHSYFIWRLNTISNTGLLVSYISSYQTTRRLAFESHYGA